MKRVVLDTNCLLASISSRSENHRLPKDCCDEAGFVCLNAKINGSSYKCVGEMQ